MSRFTKLISSLVVIIAFWVIAYVELIAFPYSMRIFFLLLPFALIGLLGFYSIWRIGYDLY